MVYVYGDKNYLGARLIIGVFSIFVFKSFQKGGEILMGEVKLNANLRFLYSNG